MNIEEARTAGLLMPGATERCPYGPDTLALEVDGKQFALLDLSGEWPFYNLKVDPEYSLELQERYSGIRPAFHMNKKHWISVDFHGDVPDSLHHTLIALAFWRTVAGFSRKRRLQLRFPSDDVSQYVEQVIVPRYDGFDAAHRREHVRAVIARSIELTEQMPGMNPDMVYVTAAFHDTGLVNGRENHHHDSRAILESDAFLRTRFTPDEIKLMGEAVEDHRASAKRPPRNPYGMIVAEADRQIDFDTILRRTVQYGLAHYPELTREGHRERTLKHLTEKYGPEGYLKIWLPWSDNAQRLKEIHEILDDKARVNECFEREYALQTGMI